MIDPIVEEVRRFRTEHARRFNFDLHAICADIRRFEIACGHEVVELPPKRVRRDRFGKNASCADEEKTRAWPL
jgi:hypothetical protein